MHVKTKRIDVTSDKYCPNPPQFIWWNCVVEMDMPKYFRELKNVVFGSGNV